MNKSKRMAGISWDDVVLLLKPQADPEGRFKLVMFLVGVFLTPITLLGAMIGYKRAYEKYLKPEGIPPLFLFYYPIVRFSMAIHAVLIWVVLVVVLILYVNIVQAIMNDPYGSTDMMGPIIYLIINAFVSAGLYIWALKWQKKNLQDVQQESRFGSAKWMNIEDFDQYKTKQGIFIGSEHAYNQQGHFITVAGTRGGKGVNLIIPNLLGAKEYIGSWVVIDPKGENMAITSRYQEELGRRVIRLNPWGVGDHYNPLEILDPDNPEMSDDAMILAEMIVPIDKKVRDDFFKDSARSMITGILMHLVITEDEPKLEQLWEKLRGPSEGLDQLFQLMRESPDSIVETTGNQFQAFKKSGEKTFQSILAVAQQYTDFIKSPAIRESTSYSDFSAKDLTQGNTTLYLVIPADKLKSHYQWMRLVVVSLMRQSMRNKNKQVTFLLDEFATLGYISEIEIALSTYAGYNITVWPILQTLIQLKNEYGDNWETFMGNTAVKHFFTIRDNFTANYVANLFGRTTVMTTDENQKVHTTERFLITPDELMRSGGDSMFLKIDDLPPYIVPKRPYYFDPILSRRADNF